MQNIERLRQATSIDDLALLLNFKPKNLAYVLYKLDEKYQKILIPKKNGEHREILIPEPRLKKLQSNLAKILQNYLTENKYTTPPSHGFEKKRSIQTNAQKHRKQRWILNIDIENFFGSINFGRVRGCLIKDKSFQLHPKVATIIAQIACHENSLPQGAPSSPVISNIVCRTLDYRLMRLARKHNVYYTRYADDITFSTRTKDFPEALAKIKNNTIEVGKNLEKSILRLGFQIKTEKTRLQSWHSRQQVTGLVVNSKVNVRAEYRKKARAMVHRLVTTGSFEKEGIETRDLDYLQGVLGHIDQIDRKNKPKKPGKSSKKELSSQEKTYQKFLIYKFFFNSPKVTIITEGKTDKLHLKTSLKNLIEISAEFESKISFHPCDERRTNEIIELTGGTSPIKKFLARLKKTTKNFKKENPSQAIILIDSDHEFNSIKSLIKQNFNKKINIQDDYFQIYNNFYVVTIPPKNGKGRCIEELYNQKVLAQEINGKSFNRTNDKCKPNEFGKIVFYEKIINPLQKKINFSDFLDLWKRIDLAINHYQNKSSAKKNP